MDAHFVQLAVGFSSSMLFVTSNFPMLSKAIKTRDMSSYSFGNLALRNLGNIIYWLYVISLPVGPVWFLQGFFTIVSLLML